MVGAINLLIIGLTYYRLEEIAKNYIYHCPNIRWITEATLMIIGNNNKSN